MTWNQFLALMRRRALVDAMEGLGLDGTLKSEFLKPNFVGKEMWG